MFRRIMKRIFRQPLSNIAVLLFAAVLTVVLCCLHRAGEEEQKSFQETYASVPVFFKVTDLDGSKVSTPGGIEGWILEQFTERGVEPTLAPYVGEIHTRVSYYRAQYEGNSVTLTGITSTYVAEELTESWGGSIYWNEGYDESSLKSEEFVCLVPEILKDKEEIELVFSDRYYIGDYMIQEDIILTSTYQVAGYYTDPGNSRIYCSISAIEWLYSKLGRSKPLEALGAILKDNNDLEALRETASHWFAEPNPTGEQTPWGKFGYEYYSYALDIDDTMLKTLESNMKNSLRMNKMAAAIVFVLSAGAGFLTGFLVIRSRKREIALMRTMGQSHGAIYLELALEQLACIVLGVLIGGGYTLWQPTGKLCLFGGIYFAGLTAALLVFLRINLLSVMKEDE